MILVESKVIAHIIIGRGTTCTYHYQHCHTLNPRVKDRIHLLALLSDFNLNHVLAIEDPICSLKKFFNQKNIFSRK